jgi:hypothetical protein
VVPEFIEGGPCASTAAVAALSDRCSAAKNSYRSLSAQQSKVVPERAAAVAEFIEASKGGFLRWIYDL